VIAIETKLLTGKWNRSIVDTLFKESWISIKLKSSHWTIKNLL